MLWPCLSLQPLCSCSLSTEVVTAVAPASCACTNCLCAPCSLSILWGKLERDWQRMGYFYEEGQTRERQSGVVRPNCIDCLDRTNVVQGVLGRKHLESVLRRLQLLQPGSGLPEAFPGVTLVLPICTTLCPTDGWSCIRCCAAWACQRPPQRQTLLPAPHDSAAACAISLGFKELRHRKPPWGCFDEPEMCRMCPEPALLTLRPHRSSSQTPGLEFTVCLQTSFVLNFVMLGNRRWGSPASYCAMARFTPTLQHSCRQGKQHPTYTCAVCWSALSLDHA